MKRMIVLVAGLALVAAGGVWAEETKQGPSGKELFETKCSACHALERPLGKKKNRTGWEMTIRRMQTKRGGWITTPQANSIIDYLTEIRGQ